MRSRRVTYGPRAEADFERIFKHLSDLASPYAALAVVERIEATISRLNLAAERGTRRDDLIEGLRIVPLGDRAVCAIRVRETDVLVVRVFYGGEDWEALVRRDGLGLD